MQERAEEVSLIDSAPGSSKRPHQPLSTNRVQQNRLQLTSILGAEGLRKSYRHRAVVKDVSIEIRQGETVGLLGPNGAGKTTIFYIIVGLERPDEGRILLGSQDISRLPM